MVMWSPSVWVFAVTAPCVHNLLHKPAGFPGRLIFLIEQGPAGIYACSP